MPDWFTGAMAGFLSAGLANLVARILSARERQENSLRSNYEVLLKRISQLEAREKNLMDELDQAEKKLDQAEKRLQKWEEDYVALERRYFRLLREGGPPGGVERRES